jgi:hypothetical protein
VLSLEILISLKSLKIKFEMSKILSWSAVIMHKHQTNARQKARSCLCATYINYICVLEIKVLFAQTKKGAGGILRTACESCLCQNRKLTNILQMCTLS